MATQQNLTLGRWTQELARMERRAADLTPVMRVGRVRAVSEVKRRFEDGRSADGVPWLPLKHTRPRGGSKPLLDTGLMRASLHGSESRDSITVATNAVQARLHQYGGIVVPRKSKYLAIPVTRESARAGSPRRMRGELSPRLNRARSAGVLLDEDGVVQFALVKSVTVPARPFMGWSDPFLSWLMRASVGFVFTGRAGA